MTGPITASEDRVTELRALLANPMLQADARGGDREASVILEAARADLREAERADTEGTP
jgi:hypothetical protein